MTDSTKRLRLREALGALVLLGFLAGSAGAIDDLDSAPGSDSRFPSLGQLEDLAASPLPEGTRFREVTDVAEWTLTGPFPNVSALQRYREPSDWGGLLENEANQHGDAVLPTEAMHCAAREWGLFHLTHGTQPAAELTRWIGARCGASTPVIRYHHFDGGVPASATEAEVFEAWGPAVESLAAENLGGGQLTAGIWYGRKDNHAIAVLTRGERKIRFAPVPMILEGDGTFLIKGETLVEAGIVEASVNLGKYGVSDCERHQDVLLPRFLIRCKTNVKDPESWLSLTLTEPGRLLGSVALELVLFPSGDPKAHWQRPSLGAPLLVGPDTDVESEITTLVNRVRKKAGLGALTFAPKQSETAKAVAPHFFSSAWGFGEPATSDLVVLGLMAGWEVDGIVQTGDFASSWVIHSQDLDQLVASVLQSPSGRRALLSPKLDQIAVGSVVDPAADILGSVFGTYSIFEEGGHDRYARQVLVALDSARAARGKSRAGILTRVASLGRFAASRVQDDETPQAVLQDLLKQASKVLGRTVNGWSVETTDLSKIPFPPALLDRDPLEVAIGVSHRASEADAWGRFVVLFVTTAVADPDEI